MVEQWNMKTFMKGASILTIAAIIVKLLGAVYRIPFQNLVGDKGFYIYQQVYPFIGIFIIWTSYGFAVAVSKLLAESKNHSETKAIMRVAFIYLAVLSITFFVLSNASSLSQIGGWYLANFTASLNNKLFAITETCPLPKRKASSLINISDDVRLERLVLILLDKYLLKISVNRT